MTRGTKFAASRILGCVVGAFAGLALSIASASADAVADFYKGRTISLVVGYGPGGGYDIYARLLSRHMGRYIPGAPGFTVQNMPGAGSLRAASYIYAVAPKDGGTIGAIDRQVVFSTLLGTAGNVQFDQRKVKWIGSLSTYADDAFMLFVRKDAPSTSISELRDASRPPVIVGGIADGSSDNDVVNLLRVTAGLNLRLIPGYPDGNSVSLALDRGEVQARMLGLSATQASRPEWLATNGPVQPLVQFGRTARIERFPNVPTARELAKDKTSLAMIEIAELPYQLSRPYIAPPDVPADRVQALQDALMAAAADKGLLEEAKKLQIDISPAHGRDANKLIESIASASPETLDALRTLFTNSAQR